MHFFLNHFETRTKFFSYSNVLDKMKNNPHFPLPQPRVEEVKVLSNILREMLSKKNAIPVLVRKGAQNKLSKALGRLAMWVQTVSNGDSAIILSTGFDVRKLRTKASLRPAPIIKRSLKMSQPGCIKLMWYADKLSNGYRVYLSEADKPHERKAVAFSSKSNAVVSGLESGKRYLLEVCTLNSAGIGPFSGAIVICEAWA
jgi:hypothetical protein